MPGPPGGAGVLRRRREADAASVGFVVVTNYHSLEIQILAQSRDFWGHVSWVHVTNLSSGAMVILGDIPSGAILGFRSVGQTVPWQPTQISFPSSPLYAIDLTAE